MMGEPVGDYRLSWTVLSIKLMDPERKKEASYTPAIMPKALEKAVAHLELYIDGYAAVNGQSLSHRFNTGLAVRPDGTMSHNTSGSPNWKELFVRGNQACKNAVPDYLPVKEAKVLFVAGIKLDSVVPCPESSVSNLGALEAAIDKLCDAPGTDKRYSFCPKQIVPPKKPPVGATIEDAFDALEDKKGKAASNTGKPAPQASAGAIDDGFSQMEAEKEDRQRRHAAAVKLQAANAERERKQQERHDEAVSFCRAALKSTVQCLQESCNSEPAATMCLSRREDPPPPCKCSGQNCGCLVFPSYTCTATGPNPAYAQWNACRSRAASSCRRDDKLPPTQEACVMQREQVPATENKGSMLDRLKQQLRESARCKPEKGEKCEPRRNGGSGIRG